MARVVSEIVDVYVFRRRDPCVDYLLLRRSEVEVLPGTWQAVHGRIRPGETAPQTALRELSEETGLEPLAMHQIDVVNENEARGRCYYAVLTDKGLDHWGRYVDEYRKLEGEWRFWKRVVTVDAGVPDGWSQASETTAS